MNNNNYVHKRFRKGKLINDIAKVNRLPGRESDDMQRVNRFNILQGCRYFCLSCCIFLFSIASGGVFNISFADEGEKEAAITTGQIEIETGRKVKPQWKMPEHYPVDGFDGMGLIDRIAISDGEIVINDSLFLISSETRYSTPSDVNASGHLFRVGMKVGYVLDTGKKIDSIWLIDMKKRR